MEASRVGAVAKRMPTAAAPPRPRSILELGYQVAERLGYDVLLVAAVAALAAIFLMQVGHAFDVDSWLALMAGRVVWESGIPHHETLTVISHGAAWVDQQWLSQLVTYGEYEIGGLGLVALVNVTLIISGIAGAAIAARRFGAGARSVLLLLPICAWLVLPSGEVRTQAFAVPLFVMAFYLLAADNRRPSRRVYWCLPLLVLWANVHGSASLGAGLVALRGLVVAWERRGELTRSVRAWARPITLTLGGPLCLLLTPYGTSVISYYHATLFNATLKHAVTEWQPVTSSLPVAIPFFILAGAALWSFGRHIGRTTLWERAAMVALAVGGIDAIRNVSFFAFAALIVVSVSLDGLVGSRGASARLRPRINGALALGALGVAFIAAIATAVKSAQGFEQTRLIRVLDVVKPAMSADPSLRVFADQRSADWLLWRAPNLAGRVAYDVRFELLSEQELRRLQLLTTAAGPSWKDEARGYRLLVLDAKDDPLTTKGFLAEPGRRVLYDDGTMVVILRAARAAD
jgi:hypothetical protein